MSTQEGALRPNSVTEVGLASLAHIEPDMSADDIRLKTHYLWNPFDSIKLVGPDGLKIRLGKGRSFYGQGRPGESYEEYMNRGGDSLRRCLVYPIYNIIYDDTIYNVNPGSFPVEQREGGSGNILGQQAKLVTRNLSAGVCAADFERLWGDSHGARSLVPLIGQDEDLAAEIIQLVQPYNYKLTAPEGVEDQETLFYDLTYTAPLRIKGANLSPDLAKLADATRIAMRSGVLRAIQTAQEAREALFKTLNDSKMGRPGKTTPSVYDEQVAFLLGEVVPSSVSRPRADMESNILKALDRLGSTPQTVAFNMDEAAALLQEIKNERAALAQEREDFEQAKTRKK